MHWLHHRLLLLRLMMVLLCLCINQKLLLLLLLLLLMNTILLILQCNRLLSRGRKLWLRWWLLIEQFIQSLIRHILQLLLMLNLRLLYLMRTGQRMLLTLHRIRSEILRLYLCLNFHRHGLLKLSMNFISWGNGF